MTPRTAGHRPLPEVADEPNQTRCSCGWGSGWTRSSDAAVDLQLMHLRWVSAATADEHARRALERARELQVDAQRQMARLHARSGFRAGGRRQIRERRVALRIDLMERLTWSCSDAPERDGSRLDLARALAGITHQQLWLAYFANGGSLDVAALAAVLAGRRAVSRFDHDVVVYTLNEQFTEAGLGQPVDYWTGST